MGLESAASRSLVSSSSAAASNSSSSVIFELFDVFVEALLVVDLDFVGPLASDERAATSFKAVVRDFSNLPVEPAAAALELRLEKDPALWD